MRPSTAALLLSALFVLPCPAQQPVQQPAPQQQARRIAPGSVTGHIVCADTQRPARLAKVALVAAAPPLTDRSAKQQEREDELGTAPATDYVETTLDGSFRIDNVRPGEYYLIVDQDGYRLPLSELTARELHARDEATATKVARLVKPILVASGQNVIQDITLERGAAISGTVTYDDGSPAVGLGVQLLAKDAKGKWVPGVARRYRSGFGNAATDDQGRFRISGLPPGEFVVRVDLTLSEYTTTTTTTPGAPDQTSIMRMQQTKFELPLFSGNALRDQQAVPVTVGSGEERTGADLQFPLSKLHRVTGQLIAKDGHSLNGGTVQVLNADDRSKVTQTDVSFEDSAFHLEFIPEGNFLLQVSSAADLTHIQVDNPPGSTPKTHTENKTLKTYGEAEQPLVVTGELTAILIPIPDQGKTSKPTPDPTTQQ
jgi:hypothetical protein